jgi:hypothetical protein
VQFCGSVRRKRRFLERRIQIKGSQTYLHFEPYDALYGVSLGRLTLQRLEKICVVWAKTMLSWAFTEKKAKVYETRFAFKTQKMNQDKNLDHRSEDSITSPAFGCTDRTLKVKVCSAGISWRKKRNNVKA